MSLPQKSSTAEQSYYTWVAQSRSESSSFTALAMNKLSSSSSSSSSESSTSSGYFGFSSRFLYVPAHIWQRISRYPSGTTLSWRCSFSTTNAVYESLGLCRCVLFFGLVASEHHFPREGAKYARTHSTHTHTGTGVCDKDWIDYLSIFAE